MRMSKGESPCDVVRWVESRAAGVWPADPRLAQFAPRTMRTRELLGLPVGRTAPELCAVWTPERAAVFGLRAGRACARGSPLFGERACTAGGAVRGGAAIHQSAEARASQGGGLRRVAICESTDQLCRLGVVAAGAGSGACAAGDRRLSRRPRGDDRADPVRSATRSEEPRYGSQGADAATGPAFADPDARQELGLSRTARTDC